MTERKDTNQLREDLDVREARQAWTRRQLDRIAALTGNGPAPRYGTTDWAELADTDPRKWAAVLATAEGSARDEDELPERVETELDAVRKVDDRTAAEAFAKAQRISREARKRPRYDDKRAREREEVKPKPGEYRGGPVSWEPNHPRSRQQEPAARERRPPLVRDRQKPSRTDVPRPRQRTRQEAPDRDADDKQEEDPVERARLAVTAATTATTRRRDAEVEARDPKQTEPITDCEREALWW